MDAIHSAKRVLAIGGALESRQGLATQRRFEKRGLKMEWIIDRPRPDMTALPDGCEGVLVFFSTMPAVFQPTTRRIIDLAQAKGVPVAPISWDVSHSEPKLREVGLIGDVPGGDVDSTAEEIIDEAREYVSSARREGREPGRSETCEAVAKGLSAAAEQVGRVIDLQVHQRLLNETAGIRPAERVTAEQIAEAVEVMLPERPELILDRETLVLFVLDAVNPGNRLPVPEDYERVANAKADEVASAWRDGAAHGSPDAPAMARVKRLMVVNVALQDLERDGRIRPDAAFWKLSQDVFGSRLNMDLVHDAVREANRLYRESGRSAGGTANQQVGAAGGGAPKDKAPEDAFPIEMERISRLEAAHDAQRQKLGLIEEMLETLTARLNSQPSAISGPLRGELRAAREALEGEIDSNRRGLAELRQELERDRAANRQAAQSQVVRFPDADGTRRIAKEEIRSVKASVDAELEQIQSKADRGHEALRRRLEALEAEQRKTMTENDAEGLLRGVQDASREAHAAQDGMRDLLARVERAEAAARESTAEAGRLRDRLAALESREITADQQQPAAGGSPGTAMSMQEFMEAFRLAKAMGVKIT